MSDSQPPIEDDSPEWEVHTESDIGPFGMVPLWLLEKQPSSRALHVYCILAAKFMDRATNNCWPTRKTIADIMGVSPSTVDRGLEELVELGILVVKGRAREDGSRTSNAYHVRLTRPRFDDTPSQICIGGSADLHRPLGKSEEAITRIREPEPISIPEKKKPGRIAEWEKELPTIREEFRNSFADVDDAIQIVKGYGSFRFQPPSEKAKAMRALLRERARTQSSFGPQRNGNYPAKAVAEAQQPVSMARDWSTRRG